jgi:DNA-binding response OmpR family regulator
MSQDPPRHALVVDDDPQVHEQAAAVLAAFGYVVHRARNAADALRLSAETMPDLLLAAVMLPDAVGLELASRLRALSSGLTVVYMSACSDLVRVSGALHPGSGALQKPFAPEQLAEEIARLVPEQAAPCAANAIH